MDDVVGWATTLDELFQDTVQFLTHTNAHGVVQNPKKFNWGKQELEYVGFQLLKDGVRPSDETLSAISDFPRPTDITGIRSWFGLIEQVAFGFSKSRLMEPFRPLLKPKATYIWTQELQHAFDIAKKEIVKLVHNGVKTFQLALWTCVIFDWSKTGIGFVMWQKHCKCPLIHPSCCQGGWKIVLCGARFCTAAESRYHPIEGELLGLTWALEKTGYYTLG